MTYVRAADLGNGLVWYPILGVGTVLITLAAVLVGPLARPTMVKAVALAAAGAGTVAHTAATSRAAPTLLSLRRGDVTAAAVETALDRFATINVVRAAAMVAILAARAWALTTTIRARTLCREHQRRGSHRGCAVASRRRPIRRARLSDAFCDG